MPSALHQKTHSNKSPSIFEFLTLVVWIILFALLVNECQSFDAAEDAVADVLSTEEANAINSIPGQDSAIMGLRAATWLSGTNSSFIFLTLIACSKLACFWIFEWLECPTDFDVLTFLSPRACTSIDSTFHQHLWIKIWYPESTAGKILTKS